MRIAIFSIIGCFLSLFQSLQAEVEPRTILVLYHGDEEAKPLLNPLTAEDYAEMPLNQLGLKIALFDLKNGLPNYSSYPDLRGIFSWLQNPSRISEPLKFLVDLKGVIEKGVKFVTFGYLSFDQSESMIVNELEEKVDEIFALLGLESLGRLYEKDYRLKVSSKNRLMVGFEHPIEGYKASYDVVKPIAGQGYLTVQIPDLPGSESTLVFTSPNGGYVAPEWAVYNAPIEERDTRAWLINPFLFFKKAFATENLPKPDPTTFAGRRVFYSQIDGDGFYNVSHVSPYFEQRKLCMEAIMKEIFIPYPEIPISFAPIAAEIDTSWVATDAGIKLAKQVLALPNIEVGSHTLSHPFFWGFFYDYTPEKELPYLKFYRYGTWLDEKKTSRFISVLFSKKEQGINYDTGAGFDPQDLTARRAYANYPFNLKDEMMGSVERINKAVAPSGKTCDIYQWSGNARPFEEAIKLLRQGGIPNINGGDTRFDTQFPSYACVAPIGRLVGEERQIYSSASNENTYTDLWTDKFFAYKQVLETYWNTEIPIRVKPVNLYFHCYSGERLGSLLAIKSNLDAIRKMSLCYLRCAHYSKIADGFYTTSFESLGEKKWRVTGRGELQTIRFDQASNLGVHFEDSKGVIGQRHILGSLYVALDPEEGEPIISLFDAPAVFAEEPPATSPYLFESRSPITQFKTDPSGFSLLTEGFGAIDMIFIVPERGDYAVTFDGEKVQIASDGHTLFIKYPKQVREITCQKI